MSKPTIPEVIGQFRAYVRRPQNAAWGSLHIVLEDHNLEDDSVRFCMSFAEERGDAEGAELARLLLTMSKTQRGKIGRLARQEGENDA